MSGSTTLAVTPGTGRPTVPSFVPFCVASAERWSGMLTATSGDSSVVP